METDPSLKHTAELAAFDLAGWLCRREFERVERATPALPAKRDQRLANQVYTAYPTGGEPFIFHIEFQGRGTRRAVPKRMLDSIVRLADFYAMPIYSTVIYLAGVGADDTGIYRVADGMGNIALQCQYHVVWLWQMRPGDILALGRPRLLPLIGQTRITPGERAQVVAAIPPLLAPLPRPTQIAILESMANLSGDKEFVAMLEQLMVDSGMPETVAQQRARELREATAQLRAERAALLDTLAQRIGTIEHETRARVIALDTNTYTALLAAILAFTAPADLAAWLDAHAPDPA